MNPSCDLCNRAETGAIILHIAGRHSDLLPDEAKAHARAISWMFCALNTVELQIIEREIVSYLRCDKPWHQERLPIVEDRVRDRLGARSRRLGDADWLEGAFSAGDILMISVLQRSRSSRIMDAYPNISAYVPRGEARPAYRHAFAAQLAVYTAASTSGQGLPRV